MIRNVANVSRGVSGAVCGFNPKSHPNHKRKNMRFGLVQLDFRNKIEPNQTKLMGFDLVRLVRFFIKKLLRHTYTYR